MGFFRPRFEVPHQLLSTTERGIECHWRSAAENLSGSPVGAGPSVKPNESSGLCQWAHYETFSGPFLGGNTAARGGRFSELHGSGCSMQGTFQSFFFSGRIQCESFVV